MLFVLAIGLATALFFGTAPAFHADESIACSMRASSLRTVDRGRRRMRDVLIVVEVALAWMLLGSGFLMCKLHPPRRSKRPEIRRRSSRRPSPYPRRGSPDVEQALGYQRLLVERLSAVPGTSKVALTSALPMQGWTDGMPLANSEAEPGEAPAEGGGVVQQWCRPRTWPRSASPTSRPRARATDTASSTPVVVINQVFASCTSRASYPNPLAATSSISADPSGTPRAWGRPSRGRLSASSPTSASYRSVRTRAGGWTPRSANRRSSRRA